MGMGWPASFLRVVVVLVVVVGVPASSLRVVSCNNGIEIDSKIRSRYAIIIKYFRSRLTWPVFFY